METIIEMPKLDGSEKQVEWAETLRATFLKRFDDALLPTGRDGGRARSQIEQMEHLGASATHGRIWRASRAYTGLCNDPNADAREAAIDQMYVQFRAVAYAWAATQTDASDWINSRTQANHGFTTEQADELAAIVDATFGESI